MTIYTNTPSRFGGCLATHNPNVSQSGVTPAVVVTPAGGSSGRKKKKKVTVIHYSDLAARDRIEALKNIEVRSFEPPPIEDEDEIILLAIARTLH